MKNIEPNYIYSQHQANRKQSTLNLPDIIEFLYFFKKNHPEQIIATP